MPLRLLILAVLVVGQTGCTVVSRTAAPAARGASEPPDLVVLVHGMGRTPWSMIPLERHLERAGYRVLNFGYSSVGPSVPTIGHHLAAQTREALREVPSRRVHFVGHSLGGIVIRWMLANERPGETGRVVLLAPPNQGSVVADRMTPLVGWLLRPIRDLRTAEGGFVHSLPPDPGIPMLIVAGESDGKVSPEEAFLSGAEAEVVVPGRHTFLMMRPSIMNRVERYLRGEETADPPCEGGRPTVPCRYVPDRATADPATADQATETSSLR